MRITLTQNLIDRGLKIQPGRQHQEFCDMSCQSLYLEIRASNPTQGTYYLRHRDGSATKHYRLGTSNTISLAVARQKANALKSELVINGKKTVAEDTKPAELLVSDLFEQYVFPHNMHRKRSHARDLEMYKLKLKPIFGSMYIRDVTGRAVQLFHTQLLQEKKAPATCDHYVKLLRSAYNHAVRWNLIEKSPLNGIKLFNADNRIDNIPDSRQLSALLKVLQTDSNRTVCRIALLLLASGARVSELLSAKWSMVDRKNRVWRIPALSSKSKQIRSVPLSDAAMDVINQLQTEGHYDYLFVNTKTGLPYTTVQKVWCRLKRKAGLSKMRLHDLRHCNASYMVSSGVSLYVVQDILGHSDPKITMRYCHVASDTKLSASNTASAIIKAAMPFNITVGKIMEGIPEAVA